MNTLFFWLCLLGFSLTTTQSRSLQRDSPPRNQNVRNTALFKALEARFLKMFGLTKKPVINENTRVPQYLLDLYNNHIEDDDYVTTNIASKDFITTANTARAFYHTDMRDPTDGMSNGRTKRRVAIDIGSVPSREELVKSEFRIYRNASRKLDYPKHLINVYQILQPGVGGKSVKKLLDSRAVDAKNEGWESYDILTAVQHWRDRPLENHGLEVDIMSENGNPVDISHLRFDKPQELDESMWPHRRPLLVVYTKDHETHHHKQRTKRSFGHGTSQDNLCRRHELKVNFTELRWNWITAPKDYPAYYCKGECVFPMAEHMNTTNHAIVQTLVHANGKKSRKGVPPACCIPTSYESLGIIYYDNATRPVYKRFKEMIATGCGCR